MSNKYKHYITTIRLISSRELWNSTLRSEVDAGFPPALSARAYVKVSVIIR